MMRSLLSLATCLVIAVTTAPASGEKVLTAKDFFGVYVGQTISIEGEGLTPRDLSVTIKPPAGKFARSRDGGFNVSWTTVTKRRDGSKRRKSYSIDFIPSNRSGIYGSAMRRDMFGNPQPIDPLMGEEPFVWARLKGSTLTVHALLITDNGGYELQTYNRTLTNAGLRLEFRRFRNGERMKTITGLLKRKK